MKKYELNLPTQKIQTLIESLLDGMPITYACDLAMIPNFYISRWNKSLTEYLELVEAGEEDGSLLEPPTDKNDVLVYSKLNTVSISVVIKNARAMYLRQVKKNMVEDSSNWQKWAWILERSFRDEFGKEVQTDMNKVKVESIRVVYVDPKDQKDRLSKLEKEVKESLSINEQ